MVVTVLIQFQLTALKPGKRAQLHKPFKESNEFLYSLHLFFTTKRTKYKFLTLMTSFYETKLLFYTYLIQASLSFKYDFSTILEQLMK